MEDLLPKNLYYVIARETVSWYTLAKFAKYTAPHIFEELEKAQV